MKKEFLKSNVNESEIISFLFDELETMTTDIVIKLDYRARKYETVETRADGVIYVEAIDRMDVFEAHKFYEPEIINKIGLSVGTILSTGEKVTSRMFEDFCLKPYTIPNEYKQLALEEKRVYIINNYVEPNDYYRELNGEPPINESPKNFVYLKYQTDATEEIDITKIPVHEFPRDVLVKMQLSGELDEVIEMHPEKRYLRHLLELKIPYNISRKASNFSILYLNKPKQHELLSDRFVAIYNQTVKYVNEVIYDSSFKINDEYYDAFIGLFILTITIQRFIVNYIKSGIKREFFNKSIIKMYLDSYGIPFYGDISLTYLTRIAKNLNILLLFKSTDQIFTDIFELFGMKDSQIYKYFLLKERKTDANGEPIFVKKEIINDYGEKEIVDDLQSMYDLKFVSIPANTKQLSVDILDKSKYIDYDLVVDDDVLWGGDGDREAYEYEVLKAEFNYIETKYISMTSKYEVSKLGFELCYFFKMIEDLKDEQSNLRIITPLGQHDLFDVFVAMFGLASIQLNFNGEIMDTNTKVLSVLGFNFDKDKEYIDQIIKDINHRDPKSLIIDDRPETFKTKADLLNFYFKNREIHDVIVKNRRNAKTIKEVNAYTKLYRSTLLTKYTNDMYRLKDGTIARTYVDYLEEKDVNLFKLLKETNKDNVVENLDSVLVWLEEYFKTDKFDNIFLNIPTLSLDSIKRFIFYLIDIFKSYTVDLLSMNIIYNMGDKYSEIIKVLDEYQPTSDMGMDNSTIRIKDKNEYPYPFEMMLKTYIEIRDKMDIKDTSFLLGGESELINVYDKYNIQDDIDLNAIPENSCNYIYDDMDLSSGLDLLLKENIKFKDYIYIEEVINK